MLTRIRPSTRAFKNVSTTIPNLQIHPAVQQALHEEQPVVALESTIITHGLPKPDNYNCARSLERIIRAEGATPATVAVIRGTPYVGLDNEQLEYLADSQDAVKASRRDLTFCVGMGQTAGTTVSGTMVLAQAAGIEIFATGGIGGVHQGAIEGAQASLDVSADLTELSKIPVMVVSAGIKSILDIPKTLEYLETQAVPVATLSDTEDVDFPGFYFQSSGVKSPRAVFGPANAADFWIAHRDSLLLESGFLLAVPPDVLTEEDQEKIAEATRAALQMAKEQGISGKETTPFLLDKIHRLSEGASLKANVSLIEKNASVAAQIANYLCLKRQRRNWEIQKLKNRDGEQAQIILPLKTKPSFTVLGGSNLDIYVSSKSGQFARHGVSNDVKTQLIPGGVGRNLAEAFARCMRTKTSSPSDQSFDIKFITPVGDDLAGEFLQRNIADLGLLTVPPVSGKSTGTYTSLFHDDGSIEIAGADMDISNQYSRDELELGSQTYPGKATMDHLENSKLLLCDLNLPAKLIKEVCQGMPQSAVKIADPTSVYKVDKLFEIGLENFDVLTPNMDEYLALCRQCAVKEYGSDSADDYKIEDFIDPDGYVNFQNILYPASRYLPNKIILLTMDQSGVLLIDNVNKQVTHYPVDKNESWPNSSISNVSGSGDTLTGGFASRLANEILTKGDLELSPKILDAAVKFGLEAAQYSLRSEKPVSEKISTDLVPKSEWPTYKVQI